MILVTGSHGQLGVEIKKLLSNKQAIMVDKETCDISRIDSIRKIVVEHNVSGIINCAAYTNVDGAEEDPESAYSVNKIGVKNLAMISTEKSLKLIHISTDYVFNGEKKEAYIESDQTDPKSVYGKSKLEGEREILNIGGSAVIIRTSWLYSKEGANFVNTMLRLSNERDRIGVVGDQFGCPTYAKDLANVIIKIYLNMNNSSPEIYHFTNSGKTSWAEFAKEIFKISQISCKVNEISTIEFGARAQRPVNSELNCRKIQEKFDLDIPLWRVSLANCLLNFL